MYTTVWPGQVEPLNLRVTVAPFSSVALNLTLNGPANPPMACTRYRPGEGVPISSFLSMRLSSSVTEAPPPGPKEYLVDGIRLTNAPKTVESYPVSRPFGAVTSKKTFWFEAISSELREEGAGRGFCAWTADVDEQTRTRRAQDPNKRERAILFMWPAWDTGKFTLRRA